MATMAKHKNRSKVSYHENFANYRYWRDTRPYVMPVSLRRLLGMIRDVKEEADATREEE